MRTNSHKVGIISLIVLAVAILARYAFHLAEAWARTYVVAAIMALYLNCLVGVVLAFLKVPAQTHLLRPGRSRCFWLPSSSCWRSSVLLTISTYHRRGKEVPQRSAPRALIAGAFGFAATQWGFWRLDGAGRVVAQFEF